MPGEAEGADPLVCIEAAFASREAPEGEALFTNEGGAVTDRDVQVAGSLEGARKPPSTGPLSPLP